jgi:hypothetical protein
MKPDKSTYLCFTKSVTIAEAVTKFERRHGKPPERWFQYAGMTWVGPVPDIQQVPPEPVQSGDEYA